VSDSGTYLDRYLRGEHEQVWDELVALGAAVREEPLYSDALAVARETMRRARHNIETLIPRLVRVGYLFGYGWLQPPSFMHFGWNEREWYRMSLEWVRKQPPILSSATETEEELADARAPAEAARACGATGAGHPLGTASRHVGRHAAS
jgi:hypothetical protein